METDALSSRRHSRPRAGEFCDVVKASCSVERQLLP